MNYYLYCIRTIFQLTLILNLLMSELNFQIDINQDLVEQFDRIAKELFNELEFVVNRNIFFLTEIEFYVYNKKVHADPFVHKHDLQLKSNAWYFHGSGIDITIGDKASETYGGVLLRGLKSVNGNETNYYDGPLVILREVFRCLQFKKVNQTFGLIRGGLKNDEIYKSTRIGLESKNEKEREEYKRKLYRYLIDIDVVMHKYKEKIIVKNTNKYIS